MKVSRLFTTLVVDYIFYGCHAQIKAVCRDLDLLITEHFKILNTINFGGGEIEVTVRPKDKINLLERIQIDTALHNNIGIDFPDDYWHSTYGVPVD